MNKILTILIAITLTACALVWCERMDVGLTGDWFIGDVWTYSIWPWILVAGWCVVGRSVGRMMGIEGWLYQTAVGLAAVATGLYGLGLAGWLEGWLVAGAGVGLVVAGWDWKDYKFAQTRWKFNWSLIPIACIFWYIYRTLPLVTLPAVGWDECNSHLVLPEMYVATGRVGFYPWVNFSNFPPLSEMLVTMQRLYTLTPGACWSYLATLGVLPVIYRLCGGSVGGWMGVMAYLMVPMVTQYSQMVLVDPILTFYGAMLVMAVVERRSPVTVGALAGACMALKYGGAVWILIVAVVWGGKVLYETRRKQ